MKKNLLVFLAICFCFYAYAQGGKCSHKEHILDFFEQKKTNSTNDYDIKSYIFDLNVERTSRNISGNVSIAISPVASLNEVILELHSDFTIDSVLVSGKKMTATKLPNHRFSFPHKASVGKLFSATIFYRGNAPLSTNDWGNGIVQKKDATYGNDVIYSLTVPYMGHEWFPCKQVLTDLVDSVTMKITTDTSNIVASNGLLVSDVPNKNPSKHTVTWKTNYPSNYYLISFNVGKYITYNYDVTLPGKTDKMPVMNYLYNAKALQAKKPILDNMGNFLSNFSNLFGLYPFHKEKFGTIIVPLSGGMEHQTMINLATNYDKYLTAHELSHQWFGDNVNVSTLHDMWLNEGFASYAEYLTAEKLYPNEAKKYMETFHNQAFIPNGRVYVDDTTSFGKIYDNGRVYAKGAAILHTLRDEIGSDALFFGALTKCQEVYKNKSINVPIFKTFMEKNTGKDLTLFFNQWYYGYGYPRFTLTWSNQSNQLIVRSLQQGSSALTPLFQTKVEFLVKRLNQADTIVSVFQNTTEQFFKINGLQGVTSIGLDPRNVILDKLISIKEDLSLAASNVVDDNSFMVFPNPASNQLNITSNVSGDYKVEIYRNDGKRLYREKFTTQAIDISDFEKGQHVVKISSKKKVIFVKQILIIK